MDAQVTHEPQRKRFVARLEERESHLIYTPSGTGVVDFLTTYVHPALRGRGVGEALVKAGLEWARAEGLKVIPSCWFVGTVVRRHPEYAALIEG
jgi:predicted GNAT family acetyltransferase